MTEDIPILTGEPVHPFTGPNEPPPLPFALRVVTRNRREFLFAAGTAVIGDVVMGQTEDKKDGDEAILIPITSVDHMVMIADEDAAAS